MSDEPPGRKPVLTALRAEAGAVLTIEPGARGRSGWTVAHEGSPVAWVTSRHLLAPVEIETATPTLRLRLQLFRRAVRVADRDGRRSMTVVRPRTESSRGRLDRDGGQPALALTRGVNRALVVTDVHRDTVLEITGRAATLLRPSHAIPQAAELTAVLLFLEASDAGGPDMPAGG